MTLRVACLLVTRERRIFAQRAVEYFNRQTYRRRELVVVESGSTTSRTRLLDTEGDVLMIQSAAPLYHGAGLTHAHRQSKADVFVHWDDDDWQHPERLERLVDDLEKTNAQVIHSTNVLAFDVFSGRGMHWPGVVWGSSLAYRRELVERFPWNTELARAADVEWVDRVRKAGIAIHDNARPHDFIYVLHHRNVSHQGERVINALDDDATDEVRGVMGDDVRWYEELRQCLPPRRRGAGDAPKVFFTPWGR